MESPSELAERTGMIVSIGEWVFREACAALKRWQQDGYDDLRLAINLSGPEFSDAHLVDRIGEILSETGLAADRIEFEITEQEVYRDANHDFVNCRRLKDIGVGLVVDDFGTGNCALAVLAHCPVDQLKIDNTLVANLLTSDRARAACAAAIAMAHELGLKASAEGVEDIGQAGIEPVSPEHMLDTLASESAWPELWTRAS